MLWNVTAPVSIWLIWMNVVSPQGGARCRDTHAVSQVRVRILWRTRPLWLLKASPSETLLTTWAVVKCDGLAFGAFPVSVTRCFTLTSWFLNVHHTMLPFSLFPFSFSGAQRILGYVRPQRIAVVHPSKTGRWRPHLEEPLNWNSLRAALWRNWPSNANSEGCRRWIETHQQTAGEERSVREEWWWGSKVRREQICAVGWWTDERLVCRAGGAMSRLLTGAFRNQSQEPGGRTEPTPSQRGH